jgi:hypothetical protein
MPRKERLCSELLPEPGTWNPEPGTWEPGTWNPEAGSRIGLVTMERESAGELRQVAAQDEAAAVQT